MFSCTLLPLHKGRRVHENIYIIWSLIDHYKHFNKPLFFILYDFKTCFESIWLKDLLIDLCFSGLQSEEKYVLYEQNKATIMKIQTLLAYTDEFQVDMILKQGTVNGPVLFC